MIQNFTKPTPKRGQLSPELTTTPSQKNDF